MRKLPASYSRLPRLLLFVGALLTFADAPRALSQDNSAAGTTYYISPVGNDWNNGKSTGKPFKTFAHAFNKLSAGDELVLLDGAYSEPLGAGYISYTDYNRGELRYAFSDGSAWTFVVLDSVGVSGGFSSLALDPEDNVYISYYDGINKDLRLIRYAASPY